MMTKLHKTSLSFGLAIGIVIGGVIMSLLLPGKSDVLRTKKEAGSEGLTGKISMEPVVYEETDGRFAKMKWDIENAKELLDTDTLNWANNLPTPKTVQEEYFQLYMLIAYEKKNLNVLAIATKNKALAEDAKATGSLKDYISQCLKSPRIDQEKSVKDFVVQYAGFVGD